LANRSRLVPPTLAAPLADQLEVLIIIFVLDIKKIDIEDVEKDVIVKGMDR
jgi:hypothetical protein